MDFNNIKKQLNTEGNEPLPSNLDWDNVEIGILDVMESLDEKPLTRKEDKSDRNKIVIVFFLIMICLLGVFYLFQRVQTLEDAIVDIDKTQLDESVSTILDQNTTLINESSITGDKSAKLSGDNTALNTNANVMSKTKVDNSQESTQITTQSLSRTSVTSSKTNTLFSSANLFSSSAKGMLPTFNQYSGSVNRIIGNNVLPSSLQSSSLTKEKSQISSENKESLIVSMLPMMSLRPFAREPRNNPRMDIKLVQQLSQSEENFTEFSDRLLFECSLLYWNEGYGNVKPEREAYESTLPSLQLQFNYVKGLKNSFFTQIGLQYQQLESRLDYSTTIEDYTTVTLTDTIVQVQNNLVSGQQSAIIGDVEVPIDAQRKVIHHNTTKLLKVTAAFGKTWQYNAFAIDAYMGLGLGKRISSRGRTLLNDTIIDYAGTTNDFLNNKIIVDGMIGLRVQYTVSPRIGITSGIVMQKSLSNWSNELGVAMRPTVVGVHLGLGYSL